MNYLKDSILLNNRYFGMRHGESIANQEGIIVSDPANGVGKYGLTETGRNQVMQSIQHHLEQYADLGGMLGLSTLIFTSDFKRAHETAEIAFEELGCTKPIETTPSLRERHFGDFELSSNNNYDIVWTNDEDDGAHTLDNVESAEAVMQRVTQLVQSLEQSYQNETILLVAHGDTLQILQAAFNKQPASKQRDFNHLETAEIREFSLV